MNLAQKEIVHLCKLLDLIRCFEFICSPLSNAICCTYKRGWVNVTRKVSLSSLLVTDLLSCENTDASRVESELLQHTVIDNTKARNLSVYWDGNLCLHLKFCVESIRPGSTDWLSKKYHHWILKVYYMSYLSTFELAKRGSPLHKLQTLALLRLSPKAMQIAYDDKLGLRVLCSRRKGRESEKRQNMTSNWLRVWHELFRANQHAKQFANKR